MQVAGPRLQARAAAADQGRVLVWMSVALGVAALALGARWWTARTDSLGRSRSLPWAAPVCGVLAVACLIPVARRASEEDRLSDVASLLVGAPAKVHCQHLTSAMLDVSSDLGHVYVVGGVPEHSTLIKNEQCHLLQNYIGGDYRHPSQDEVVAVHVLTHESMHMRGIIPEDEAECAAVQRDARTARLLGATPDEAAQLALVYWKTVYPFMPDNYVTPDCRPGGPLDEHLADAPWSPTS